MRNGSFCYLRLIKISLCGALLGKAMPNGPSANLRQSNNSNVTKVNIITKCLLTETVSLAKNTIDTDSLFG